MSQFVFHLRDVECESMFQVELHFLEWLDEICIALWFKFVRVLRRCVFLESHGRFGFYHSLRCTFLRASGQHTWRWCGNATGVISTVWP